LILRDTRCGILIIRKGLNKGEEQKIFEGLSRVEITVCCDVILFRHCHSSDGKFDLRHPSFVDSITNLIVYYPYSRGKKVNQSRYRSGVAQRVPGS